MTRISLIVVAFVALVAAACGSKAPPPPANVNKPAPAPAVNNTKPNDKPSKQPTGPSLKTEYIKEVNAAFEAKKDYDAVRRDAAAAKGAIDEPYVKWAVALYGALALANRHEKNGHAKEDLPRFRELRQLRADLKTALGPSDDPRVKKAMNDWEATSQ